MRWREKLILLAAEPTYLGAVTLDASHYQRAMDFQITFEEEAIQDEVEQGYEGAVEDIPTGEHVTLGYKTHFFASGVAGTAPPYADALLACRLAEVVDAGVSVSYVLAADDGGSAAAHVRIGKNLHAIAGMRGKVDIVMEKGIPMLQWQFKGTWAAPTHQVSALPAVDNAPWLLFKPTGPGRTSNCSLHGQAVRPYSLSLSTGNEPLYDESLVDSQIVFSDRNASGKIQIEAPTLDQINFFSRASNRQHGPLTIQHGQTAGETATINCLNVQIKKPQYVKLDNGNVGHDIDLKLLPDAGNDEIELVFT
ncbi:hypothetical protein [Bowmanella dokdonensis]|uniref:Uncharacterized protein n=1 Tax=Bowmanella dokdonensis TaxID=751969 RepID=A0A939DL84_9ALTE|nr:hypothetical protein [Bowmanella dokdonensis]MBN7824779.1 hypothetical protein [Bowmanella dokdonensis]